MFVEAEALLAELRRAAGDRRPPRHHPTVLTRLFDELDVPGAVALALDEGGEAAAYLLDVLKLRQRSDGSLSREARLGAFEGAVRAESSGRARRAAGQAASGAWPVPCRDRNSDNGPGSRAARRPQS